MKVKGNRWIKWDKNDKAPIPTGTEVDVCIQTDAGHILFILCWPSNMPGNYVSTCDNMVNMTCVPRADAWTRCIKAWRFSELPGARKARMDFFDEVREYGIVYVHGEQWDNRRRGEHA